MLKFLFFVVFHIFNIATINNYDFGTYVNNIKTAHQDSYILTTKSQSIYKEIPKLKDINDTNYILTNVSNGQLLKSKGYLSKTGSTWIAIQYYQNDTKQHGYLYVPFKIDYDTFKINSIPKYFVSEDSTNNLVEDKITKLEQKHHEELIKNFNSSELDRMIIKDATALQIFQESEKYKDYVNIDEYGNWGVYQLFLNKKDMKEFKQIYNKYTDTKLLITI